ncbi:MAG: glutathione S-transferase family protein [Paracoccaceae bacterium]|nr:glutathione S-transferase family protein [Paracoccaceae bacterium]
MTASLTLYTNPRSRGRIARWMLEEVGQPYDVRLLGFGPEMTTPDYLALNPMGKVPTLTHGKAVVSEAAAICAYLADAFPKAGLAPKPGTPEKAAFFRWLFFAAGPVEAAISDRALGFEVPPERGGMVGYGSYERMLNGLEHAVTRTPYVAGGKFSAADVYVGAQVGWGLHFKSLPARPAFTAYWDRLKDRPACLRAIAASDAEMPKEGDRG